MARNVISVVRTGPVGPGGPPNNVGMMVGCQYYLYRGIGLADEKRRRKGPARDDKKLNSKKAFLGPNWDLPKIR